MNSDLEKIFFHRKDIIVISISIKIRLSFIICLFKAIESRQKSNMTLISLIIVRKLLFLLNRKFWIWIRSVWLLTNDVCCKQISLHLLESNKQSFKTIILIGSCDLKISRKFQSHSFWLDSSPIFVSIIPGHRQRSLIMSFSNPRTFYRTHTFPPSTTRFWPKFEIQKLL